MPVETLALAPTTRVLAVNGSIAAARSVDQRPLVSCTLAEVLVAEGDVVPAQTDLARIDEAAQQAVVRQAVAAIDAAIVAQDDAQRTYARDLLLAGTITQTALADAKRALDSATQEVARMTALFDAAQIKLDDFTIRAPIAGTVLPLDVDPGQSVDASTVLMTLAECPGWRPKRMWTRITPPKSSGVSLPCCNWLVKRRCAMAASVRYRSWWLGIVVGHRLPALQWGSCVS